uniref:Ig-like domain-containing protein n=1 Tax=Aquicoccus sp. TaxID=2055851 RepID=UPI003566E45D
MAITSVKILEQPEHGHASVNLDNSLSFTADGAKYHGPVSFSYEVTFDDMSTEIRTKRGFITGDYWTQVEAAFEAGKTETTVAGPVRSVTVS